MLIIGGLLFFVTYCTPLIVILCKEHICKEKKVGTILDHTDKGVKIEIENHIYTIPCKLKEKDVLITKMTSTINTIIKHGFGEIYLEEEYRNKGIGTKIIMDILNNNDVVYLWVYKDNKKALSLYKKLGFNVLEETETRYYMKYKNNHI